MPGRNFVPLGTHELLALGPPPSWFLGLVLCPGDAWDPMIRWAKAQPARFTSRVVAYHAPRFDIDALVEAWTGAGLPALERYEFRSWVQFHHLYGLHHSVQCFEDHHGSSPVLPCRLEH